MGFLKSSDEKKAEKLHGNILENLIKTSNQVENFKVEFCDGVATLSGVCDSPKTRKKAILFAELAEGVKDVQSGGLSISGASVENVQEAAAAEVQVEESPKAEASPRTAPQAPPELAPPTPTQTVPEPRTVPPSAPEPESQVYTVQSGDSLSKIAKQFYGNANKYMVIFEANRDLLKDPDRIYPGQELRIPPLK